METRTDFKEVDSKQEESYHEKENEYYCTVDSHGVNEWL